MSKNRYKICEDYVIMYIDRRNEILESYFSQEDFDKILDFPYKWCASWNNPTKSYYGSSTIYLGMINGKPKYKKIWLHRFIMNVNEYIDVHHKNHNTLDNRRGNLELRNRSDNSIDRVININNTSGCRNVSWSESTQRYLVQFQVNKKNKCFGRFKGDEYDKVVELANQLRMELYGVE